MKTCKTCEHWKPLPETINSLDSGYCENPEFVHDTKFLKFKSVLILGDRRFTLITASEFGCVKHLDKINTNA